MELEVVGRHTLLFDDDSASSFVNSRNALVEWNSLLIDRYDVRHLLSSLPPLLRRRRSSQLAGEESQIDQIRYQDLPTTTDDDIQENSGAEIADGSTYCAVPFSYGNTDVSFDSKNSEAPSFRPPFPVPESLLQSLPPTEKLHQIMARTAIFVSEHGGQAEIVLRVKQGGNTTFGFLMPDHHLHAYFRFLVDHPEVLKSDNDAKPDDFKKVDREQKQIDVGGEALSLLGSLYGTGDDEDGAVQTVSETKDIEPGKIINAANSTLEHGSEQAVPSAYRFGLDLTVPGHPILVAKEKSKKVHTVSAIASSTSFDQKKEGNLLDSLGSSLEKPLLLEPPSEMKRMMDKIVEFVMKNGKEFEAVLIEQDRINGRFPFLLSSNQYHPYYLNILQKAQESKWGSGSGRRTSVLKDSETLSNGSASQDFPYDCERKEKFKMVISGVKKDTQEPPPKPSQQQRGVSVDAAAAILQAATRGVRNPKNESAMKTLDDSVQSISSEGRTSSLSDLSYTSQIRSSNSKSVSKDDAIVSVELSRSIGESKSSCGIRDLAVAKAAKTTALATASEADSSEACLTIEKKRKAERLKRAKMFVAMVKSGVEPRVDDLLPHLSAGLPVSGCKAETNDGSLQVLHSSDIYAGSVDILCREREGSSVPVNVDATSDQMEKYKKVDSQDVNHGKRSRRKHHSRSRVEDYEDEEEEEEERSRKKHHSHHLSHHSKDQHKHRRGHSYSKDRESRHSHKYDNSSDDEQIHTHHSHKRMVSHSKRKVESEDENSGKLPLESNTVGSGKIDSREASLDLINDRWEVSTPLVDRPSAPLVDDGPSDDIKVPHELRAKVRAMLMETM
ncbi:hypothetical protein IFM89_011851 [Coptis chinensis]|uniref:SURP motif domain-containing protein n=1 Tax=Coptis chinensis TaxID=261450 RepID=A0A835LUL3_9MAGN|nr:hypothetical protein IFM89_011851 [Coptis chinensis]